jgi:hypothetical protein
MKYIRGFLATVDLADAFFFGGLFLLGYGLETIADGAGLALCGLLLLFYARPIARWMK